jgi:hypothetical protein
MFGDLIEDREGRSFGIDSSVLVSAVAGVGLAGVVVVMHGGYFDVSRVFDVSDCSS